jgi:hypothetical protein
MKKNKCLQLLFLLFLMTEVSFAQQTPTGNPFHSDEWHRGGNDLTGGANTNNIIGTFWNSPIYTYTYGINRTCLNGTLNPTIINNASIDASGFFGIGPNGYFAINSPWSMLHLEGPNNTSYPGAGWRRWMHTGAFMKENSDAMYVGMQQQPDTDNRSDAMI